MKAKNMGKPAKAKATAKKTTVKTSRSAGKDELYKPLSEFAWKDASREEIDKSTIAAYKKYAF